MIVTHSEHFSEDELRCKCGCGDAGMEDWFLAILERIRAQWGPMPVTSGYRCPDYNELVSRTGRDGPHTQRRAVDVRVHGNVAKLITLAYNEGITGFGLSQKGPLDQRFIHLDAGVTGGPRPWLWTY